MKLLRLSLALAVLLSALSADLVFARGGGGGGGRGGGGGFRGGGGGGGYRTPAAATRAPVANGGQNFANRSSSIPGGAQAHTSYYRGNEAFNRNNSAFFGNPRGFGNAYAGNRSFNNYNNYGLGYGYGGYGGYGGFGLGYGGYGFLPFLGGLGLGYGLGGGLGGYGGGYGAGYGGYGAGYANGGQAVDNAAANQALPPQDAASQNNVPANPPTSNGTDYVSLGETDFRQGSYQQAIGAFRHALVDEPNNAGLMMLIGQSLFQTGQWTQAAAATELAMGALPEDKWGTVVQNYTQLYGNVGDYTNQLKALEAAAKEKPDDPALRFLLGFQYGYLNYPQQAVRELGKAVQLEGRDPAARRLHDVFATKIGAPLVGPVPRAETPAGAAPAGSPAESAPPVQKPAG